MPDSLVEMLDGIVHEPVQTDGRGVDLTLADVFEVTAPGRVDFGGGELEAAGLDPVETEQRNPEDDYGWWNLEAGQYLIAYNESINGPTDREFLVQTRDEVRVRGGFHPTMQLTELRRVPFAVGGAGIRLKENARVSTLLEA